MALSSIDLCIVLPINQQKVKRKICDDKRNMQYEYANTKSNDGVGWESSVNTFKTGKHAITSIFVL